MFFPLRRRRLAAVALALAVLPGTVLRDIHAGGDQARRLAIRAIAGPSTATPGLGPFRFAGAWQLSSTDRLFGGWSALLPLPQGRLLAISDRGAWLEFSAPGGPAPAPHRMGRLMRLRGEITGIQDAEAAVADGQGHIWIAWEDRRALSRFTPGWHNERRIFPAALKGWSSRFGAEAMARLADGRFLLVSEAFAPHGYDRRHETLVFAADPTDGALPNSGGTILPRRAALDLPTGFRPTDMAVLPDGRVLILLRQLVWPFPLRFATRIALADPATLSRSILDHGGRWQGEEVARIAAPLPTENYEGIALRPRTDGQLDVWLISDDNQASTQRTLLLKLILDPAALPPRQ